MDRCLTTALQMDREIMTEMSDVFSVSKRLVKGKEIFAPSQNRKLYHDKFLTPFLNYSFITVVPLDSI
jgi:hypothetical protein